MGFHLKGLLKKEWYLLKHNRSRLIVEFILPFILGWLISIIAKLRVSREVESMPLLDYGYTSGAMRDPKFLYQEYSFRSCMNNLHHDDYMRKIGLIVRGENWDTLKHRLDEAINKNVQEENKAIFQRFNSEEELLRYAATLHTEGSYDVTLCLGISFEKSGNDYNYKIFVPEYAHLTNLKDKIYDDLQL